MDRIDRAIVARLQYDGRKPFTDIAAELAAKRADVHSRGLSTEDIDWKPIIDELTRLTGLGFQLQANMTVQDFERAIASGT